MQDQTKPEVTILILAAGGSNRLGEPKQLLRLPHRTLIRHTVEEAISSKASRVVVVLGYKAEEIAASLAETPAKVVINKEWDKGMGNSLKSGMKHLTGSAAVITAVCDQPFISRKVFNELIDTWEQDNSEIVASSYSGTVGVPALFDHRIFHKLTSISDQGGAKQLLFDQSITTVPFPEGAVDIDTRADWENYLSNRQG